MIKIIFFLFIIMIIIIGFIQLEGLYIDSDGSLKKGEENVITISAKEHNNYIPIDTNINDGYTLLYSSVNDGFSIIIQDIISSIIFNTQVHVTKITFEWIENGKEDFLELFIDGDITNEYNVGD